MRHVMSSVPGAAVIPIDSYHMPTHGAAFTFLEEHAQEMFGEVRSMLYVGHRSDTSPWWRTQFSEKLGVPVLTVIDIVRSNLDTAAEFATHLIHGDIRNIGVAGYGLVFWDEGPEHVSRDEALKLLAALVEANDHVLVSCPWGYQPQGGGDGDPEFHHWGPMPEDFTDIGMRAEAFGTMFEGGRGHGNLIAWT